ncbi:MAG: hypothetical protein K6G90_11795 [Clostridia bacterium]|nr:hypothetical protein [Clostridia bacterium]
MKNKKEKRDSFILNFFRDHRSVALTIITCVLLCVGCVFSLWILRNNKLLAYQFISFAMNVMINIIAAAVFFILQVYLPGYRRRRILGRYAKMFLQERLVNRIKMLERHIARAVKNEADEEELLPIVSLDCEEIRSCVNECMRTYITVLPDSLIDSLNAVMYDDVFYMLTLLSSGRMHTLGLNDILDDPEGINALSDHFRRIEEETDALKY